MLPKENVASVHTLKLQVRFDWILLVGHKYILFRFVSNLENSTGKAAEDYVILLLRPSRIQRKENLLHLRILVYLWVSESIFLMLGSTLHRMVGIVSKWFEDELP
jgi:hypothetical protein